MSSDLRAEEIPDHGSGGRRGCDLLAILSDLEVDPIFLGSSGTVSPDEMHCCLIHGFTPPFPHLPLP